MNTIAITPPSSESMSAFDRAEMLSINCFVIIERIVRANDWPASSYIELG